MRFSRTAFTSQIAGLINRYSRYQQSCLTIEQFTTFGQQASPKESYTFLRHELPVRLSHIMKEISLLPRNLLRMPSVEIVKGWYIQSFEDLLEFQDNEASYDTVDKFTNTISNIKRRHDTVVETMAQGIIELRQSEGESALHPSIQYFLDRFYMNRISIRMLIAQHLMLYGKDAARGRKTNYIGVFDPNCRVKTVVEDAATNANLLCDQVYFSSPEVEIVEVNAREKGCPIEVVYVPSHLYHMLFELLKNAMRAVVENYGEENDLPHVKVLIALGNEDLTIKISDQGGGISKNELEQLFTYHYSTAPQPIKAGNLAPLAGYGYGLPLSRLYAKYFGGDLRLTSVEGYGTDAVVYLKALSAEAAEVLPLYNSTIPRNYSQTNNVHSQVKDWSCGNFYGGHGQTNYKPAKNFRVRSIHKKARKAS